MNTDQNSAVLLARMKKLREKTITENPNARSEANNQSTLSLFLHIYSKAEHECYIDYMQGAKDLLSWLTSPANLRLDYQVEKYPEIENTSFIVPRLLRGYESLEISSLLEPADRYKDFDECLAARARAGRAIYFAMTKEVIHEL